MPKKTKEDKIPPAEWAVAAIGLALVCLCLGFLIYKAFRLDNGAPGFSFEVESVIPQDGGALVLAKVTNTGGETAKAITIVGESGGEEQEVQIESIPARSSRDFGLFFPKMPDRGSLRFTPRSYEAP